MNINDMLWLGWSFQDWFKFLLTANLGLLIIVFFTWMFAGDLVITWITAWWKKKPIVILAGPRSFKFKVASFRSGHNKQWELDGNGMCVQARDKAIMIGPHKVPMMLANQNFPAGFNPKEAEGHRYYSPDDMFVDEEAPNYMWCVEKDNELIKVSKPTEEEMDYLNQIDAKLKDPNVEHSIKTNLLRQKKAVEEKINLWREKKLWVREPDHGINPHDFVEYQKIDTDPMLVAQYGQRKELQAKIDLANWASPITQNLHVLIPIILIIAISASYMQQHNLGLEGYQQNMACQTKYAELLEKYRVANPTTTTLRSVPQGQLIRPKDK